MSWAQTAWVKCACLRPLQSSLTTWLVGGWRKGCIMLCLTKASWIQVWSLSYRGTTSALLWLSKDYGHRKGGTGRRSQVKLQWEPGDILPFHTVPLQLQLSQQFKVSLKESLMLCAASFSPFNKAGGLGFVIPMRSSSWNDKASHTVLAEISFLNSCLEPDFCEWSRLCSMAAPWEPLQRSILGPTPELLSQNLHLIEIPGDANAYRVWKANWCRVLPSPPNSHLFQRINNT